MASGKDSQPPNRDSHRSQAPGSLGKAAAESREQLPAPPLFPPSPSREVSSLLRRNRTHSGRWPGHTGRQDAGPRGNPRNQPQPLQPWAQTAGPRPATAAPPGLPAPTQDQPLPHPVGRPTAGQPPCLPTSTPQGPWSPPLALSGSPPACLGGLLIRSPVCSHGGGLNTVFIQLHFLTYLLLTTSQALRKKTECPQPPDRLGGGSWPRVGNGPVDRLHNVWKMPLRERWGCWEGGPGFPKWGSPGGGMQDRGPGRGGGGPGSWGRMGGSGLESWHKNLHRTRGCLRKFWAPRRTGREAGTAGPLQGVLPGCVGRGHQGPRPTLGSGDGGVKGSVPHSVSGVHHCLAAPKTQRPKGQLVTASRVLWADWTQQGGSRLDSCGKGQSDGTGLAK